MTCRESSVIDTRSHMLEVTGLTKSFGPNRVLKGISIAVDEGEFVGLMGPNGAGKSTLVKILAGVYRASSGDVKVGGHAAGSLGENSLVGFVHQDLGLADGLTIAENLSLGTPRRSLFGPILDKRAERAAARAALGRVGLALHPDALVGELTLGEKALVAVARVFDRGARILVIDETTSTLSPADANRVITSLKASAKSGAAVIMVTHKLAEILNATDRVLIIVDGELVADAPTRGLDRAALVRMLRQHESAAPDEARSGGRPAEVLLELRDAQVGILRSLNLKLTAGEVVGISGLPGSGLHDIAFAMNGNLKLRRGEVLLARPGIKRALVPPHRETQSGFLGLTVRENMALSALHSWRRMNSLLDPRPEKRDCRRVMATLNVQPPRLDNEYDTLSGGNKQKVIFGRALLSRPDVYILCEPTRGVDVGTRSEIYRLIRELAHDGAAILIASSDAEDLFSVCDRVALITGGVLQPLRPISELAESELAMMV
jgi:ribose transport system ATP-binding protein